MTSPTSESSTSAGDGAGPARGQEPDPASQADGEAREEAPADGPSAAGPPDVPEEEKLSREEERAERNAIRAFRTAGLDSLLPTLTFSGATSFGGYAAERDININVGAALQTLAIGPVPADELADLRAFHVPFPGYDEARQVLVSRRVLVLRGEEDSGRRTSALALLTALVGDHILDLGQDHELESLVADDRYDHYGYLLHSVPASAVGKLTQPRLSFVERTLEKSNSFLVITVSTRREAQYSDLERYLVDHPALDPNQVIYSHLRLLCPKSRDLLEEWLADSRLAEQVKVVEKPRAVAKLAAKLAEAVAAGTPLDEFLEWARGGAQIEARRLLGGTDQVDPELRPTEQLQRCAFLVALAVFNDAPYLPVAAAAESLALLLTTAAYPRGAPDRQIFALRRDNCLRWLRGTVERRQRSNRWGEQNIEHIRLRNPDLPSALLNELWHEYDSARTPVLHWLHDLTNSRSAELRVRAAQAIGKLATDDFEYVYQEVIFGWAGSQWTRQRDAAAWALEVATVTGDAGARVRRLLHDWCRAGSRNRKLTAVTTYGTKIGADRPDEALHSLRYLARSVDPEMTRIACNSVVDLFDGGRSDQVLDTLHKWLNGGDEMTRRFAVASFVQIAYLPEDTGAPVLLPMCGNNHPRVDLLVELWRHALEDNYAKADAWEALRQWCNNADQHPDLLTPLRHLVNTLESADQDLRTRIAWYLRFWSTHPKARSKTADKIRSTSRKE